MITIFLQIADILINGAAYILSVLLGTSATKSVFTNFNFFTKVNSTDNPFLNVVMQDMIGSTTGAQFGALLYKIAFILFGLLAAVQIFKSFINPASRGNASPMRTVLWILLGAFLMIYGQDITESVLEWFTKLIQDNMAGVFAGLSTLGEDSDVIPGLFSWWSGFKEAEYLLHPQRLGAMLACSFGVGGTLMRATITYLERYISFAVTAYLGPFAMAMTACDDTRQSTVKWLQSMLGQMLGILLSVLFLYMGAQMLLSSDKFIGSNAVFLSEDMNRTIVRCVGATVFFILSSGCEKFLSVFGIQAMHFGDAAQAVARGGSMALMAVRTGFQIGSKIASDGPVGAGVAARSGLLNRLKTSPETVAQGGVKGAAAQAWNAKMDTLTQKHGGVTGTGGIKRTADGKLAFVSPEGATREQRKILDNLNNGKIQKAIANGGLSKAALQKDANGNPVNEDAFKAAKALNSYGVNDANDIARAMFGDKAFKNGENYQMATLAKGDKTGGDYLVLSGVDQNGNLAAKATRLPGAPDSRLSSSAQEALHTEARPFSDADRAEHGSKAQDAREQKLMDAGFSDGYSGLAKSMLGSEEAGKYAHINSAELTDDGELKFTGTDKDGAKITSSVSVAGSDAVATDGERLMNSKNQPIASIDGRGNVEAYGYTNDGINVSDIPIKSTYTPPVMHKVPFASQDTHEVPIMSIDPKAMAEHPDTISQQLAGATFDRKHGVISVPMACGDNAIRLNEGENGGWSQAERRENLGMASLDYDRIKGLQGQENDIAVPKLVGSWQSADGQQHEDIYAWPTGEDGQFNLGTKPENHNHTNTLAYAVTEEEAAELDAEQYHNRNDKHGDKKHGNDNKKSDHSSDDSDEAEA